MLKYEGRTSSFCGGIEHNIEREGTPLTGEHLFRNELAQRYFDKLRNQSGIVIIGKTHAIQGFGKRIVDAALCVKESQNTYYSSSAPRQYYDKNTLVYMKLEQIEKNDK